MTESRIGPIAVFDPVTGVTSPERIIAIEDGIIVDVLDGEDRSGQNAARPGMTAIPGLIDSHSHLCYDGVPSRFSAPTEAPGMLAALALNAMRREVAAGVTTVRDCGAPDGVVIQLRDAIDQGIIDGPRVLSAGRMLTMTGGHGSQIGRLVDGADSGTRGARQEIAEGADFIKLMATGGVVTKGVEPEQVALQLDEMAAIVRATHDAGKRVTAHATGLQGAKNAILAGVDSLEHGINLDDEAVGLAVERGTMLVPTFVALRRSAERSGDIPEYMRAKVERAMATHAASFARALAAGVGIAAGTDGGTPFNAHGSLAEEIELLAEFGMTPAAALSAATWGSARNCGIEHLAGRIVPGLSADIVIVEGDPLADLSILRAPVEVHIRGTRHV